LTIRRKCAAELPRYASQEADFLPENASQTSLESKKDSEWDSHCKGQDPSPNLHHQFLMENKEAGLQFPVCEA
jgi:hypothetical protein